MHQTRFLFTFFLLFLTSVATAQWLEISGTLVVDKSDKTGATGSRVVVLRNNEKVDEKTIERKGRFNLKFPFDADYKLLFMKSGYITKMVNVNTEVPEEIIEANPDFPPIKLTINLLPKVADVDLSVFEQAVAILAYNDELDDFIFDDDYASRVKTRITDAEQTIHKMMKQPDFKPLSAGQDTQSDPILLALEKEKQENVTALKELEVTQQKNAKLERKQLAESQNKQRYEQPENHSVDYVDTLSDEMKRRKVLAKYNELIALADTAFRTRSYLLSRDTYLEADALSTGSTYPQERISEINKLMDTQKWASIAEEYNAYIQQADGAKSHAIARFYYKKALEVKKDDTYAKEKLTEVEAFISERKGKAVDL